MDIKIKQLADIMRNSRHTVVMTGAGMDTESNIPDFRSKDGIWNKIDPMKVAHKDALEDNYDLIREFYSSRISRLNHIKPHKGHYVLADLEDRGYVQSIATQNVSGLHEMAGSENIYELHGNIREVICNHCKQPGTIGDILEDRNCNNCGKRTLRPAVILFGEALPSRTWTEAAEDIEKSDLLIVIGTSLEVYPVNRFPYMARGQIAYINMEDNREYNFDLRIIGKAGEVLGRLGEILL